MQNIMNCIDSINSWLVEACENVNLKKPVDLLTGEFILAKPEIFSMFVPFDELNEAEFKKHAPFAVVQLDDTDESILEHQGSVDIIIHLAVWNPGTSKDEKNDVEISVNKTYKRDAEGWRDVFAFSEAVTNKLKTVGSINGYKIDYKKGIQRRTIKEQKSLINFYPMYYLDIAFSVEMYSPLNPSNEYRHLL